MRNVVDFGFLVFLVEEWRCIENFIFFVFYNYYFLFRVEWRCIIFLWVKLIWIISICICDELYIIVYVVYIYII